MHEREQPRVLKGCRPRVSFEPGTIDDYDALAHFHYRAGYPAAVAAVYRAAMGERVVGVLVVTYPTLNGAWRRAAWRDFPGRDGSDKGASAHWLNTHVRSLSRLVIDPRVRGLGLASAMVRAYLESPRTDKTEAVSSMARACPIFEAAGMRRVECAEQRDTARLRRALGAMGVSLCSLARPDGTARQDAAVLRAVERWRRASGRRKRRFASGEPALLVAVGALLAPPIAFVSG
ncbi:MAG: hypothetical protein AAGG07_07525 [Planctomycetota bacterium]